PISPAVYVPLKSATLFRLKTSPEVVTSDTPRSRRPRPSTENGYALPPKVSVPSPHVTPMPTAMDLLVSLTVPDGAGSAAIAIENTARQASDSSHFKFHFMFILHVS